MSDFINELNEVQKEAVVNYKGASLVIAGAGAGKTRVLTYRIAYLLSQGVKPYSILALTFTNKAAKEMKERIGKLVGSDAAKNIWMGTFHSIFARILRTEAKVMGFDSNFTIYDTTDSRSLLKSIIKDLGLDEKVYKPAAVHARISMAKNNLITAQNYVTNPRIKEKDRLNRMPQIADIYQQYASRCKKNTAMDFDDLLLNTNILFRDHPEVLDKYQNLYNFLLVDEYQDTNYAQYLIVKKLSEQHKNLCVVGDDAQSIYSFRGAKIENILNFKNDYPGYQLFKLEQNYRSTQNIVNAANSIIEKNEGQIKKESFSNNESGEKIRVLQVNQDKEEGYWVASDIITQCQTKQLQYLDFAILYRTNAQSRIFEEALRRRNIAYKIYGGLSFYQRKEIKDLIAYFRLIVNKNDDEALKRVINYPARGIGGTTLDKLEKASLQVNASIWDVITRVDLTKLSINKGTQNKLAGFVSLLNDFRKKLPEYTAFDLANHVANATGILKELYNDKAPESVSRYENIQELLNGIREFIDDNDAESELVTLERYLENVALITDTDNEKEEDRNKVSLMTVHSAKGLEFKHVYIVGVEEELFPSAMSVSTQQDIEEERRLFYVAITRAEKQATLSYASTRYKWGSPTNARPSRFLKDVDPKYLDVLSGSMGSQDEANFVFDEGPSDSGRPIFQNRSRLPLAENKHTPTIAPPANFKPDDPKLIKEGMNVIHLRFGKGVIDKIEGVFPNSKATVIFNNTEKKQLLLKFAKLKIIE